jgi:hypothetical protein
VNTRAPLTSKAEALHLGDIHDRLHHGGARTAHPIPLHSGAVAGTESPLPQRSEHEGTDMKITEPPINKGEWLVGFTCVVVFDTAVLFGPRFLHQFASWPQLGGGVGAVLTSAGLAWAAQRVVHKTRRQRALRVLRAKTAWAKKRRQTLQRWRGQDDVVLPGVQPDNSRALRHATKIARRNGWLYPSADETPQEALDRMYLDMKLGMRAFTPLHPEKGPDSLRELAKTADIAAAKKAARAAAKLAPAAKPEATETLTFPGSFSVHLPGDRS